VVIKIERSDKTESKKFFLKISGHQQRWPRPLQGAILIPPAPLVVADFPAGTLLAFTVSFDNFLITYMLSGPGMTTIPVQIYSMVRFEITPKIHAFSTVIILFSMTLIIINERLIRAKRD
jgi:ABC-type molybdate transport system permease subunit